MNKNLPKNTKVIIVGGGIAGCSTAYHLAKFGWKDIILLERDQLTSGTTWHAAGLVSQLGPTAAVTKIRKYSLELYKKLEKEVDFSSGLKLNGALSIATTKGRWQELLRQATTAQLYDVNVQVLNIQQIKKIYPVINEEMILGGIFMPGDGQADPVGVTNLLAKAARNEGVQIFRARRLDAVVGVELLPWHTLPPVGSLLLPVLVLHDPDVDGQVGWQPALPVEHRRRRDVRPALLIPPAATMTGSLSIGSPPCWGRRIHGEPGKAWQFTLDSADLYAYNAI